MLGTAAVGDSALIYSFWRGKVPDRCNSTAGEKQTDFWVQLSHEKGWLSGCHSPPSHFFHPFMLQAVVCVYARRWHLELERSWHSKLVSSKRQFVHLEKNPHILYINDYFWLWFCGSRFGNRNQGAINARTVDLSWSKDASNLLLLWRAVRSQCVRSSAERDRGNVAVLPLLILLDPSHIWFLFSVQNHVIFALFFKWVGNGFFFFCISVNLYPHHPLAVSSSPWS